MVRGLFDAGPEPVVRRFHSLLLISEVVAVQFLENCIGTHMHAVLISQNCVQLKCNLREQDNGWSHQSVKV